MTVSGYDIAMRRIDAEFDIHQYDVSGLIRAIHANNGRLPATRREQYAYLPDSVLARIEEIVQERLFARLVTNNVLECLKRFHDVSVHAYRAGRQAA
jgi:hypothetical protein